MATKFGNERKDRLEGYASKELLAELAHLLSEMRFIVLNASLWRCEAPWAVPARRISDNLVVFVIDGELDFSVADATEVLGPGFCAIVPENEWHSYRFHGACERGSIFVLHALPLLPGPANPFRGFVSPFQKLRHPGAVLASLTRGVALRNYSETAAFSYVAEILRGIFLDAAEEGSYVHEGPLSRSSRLKNAYAFINENLANDIGVGDIARSVGLKEVQFRRLFRKEAGLGPSAYLHRLRLLSAARALMRYDYGLETVASMSGFHSTSYFCSSFLRFFKRTPGDFRAEFKASS